MTNCKWVASDQRRVVVSRHREDCPSQAVGADLAGMECSGCLPCPESHCVVCRHRHAAVTCPECVATTRDSLHAIASMCGALPAEVEHRGVDGEAMMLLGPSADPEAWRNRAMSAMRGRLDDAYLADCRDEQHPLWVLGTWEQAWRDHLGHDTDLEATLPRLVDYLDQQLSYMADQEDVPFDDFARDLRGCRAHLEDVLSDGVREETGAPCPECGRTLVKRYGKTEAFDRWVCTCGQWYLDSEYRRWVTDDYRANADSLTAPDMAAQYHVPTGSIRGWAAAGKVRKRGRDSNGRQLYDVADVVAARDGASDVPESA